MMSVKQLSLKFPGTRYFQFLPFFLDGWLCFVAEKGEEREEMENWIEFWVIFLCRFLGLCVCCKKLRSLRWFFRLGRAY